MGRPAEARTLSVTEVSVLPHDCSPSAYAAQLEDKRTRLHELLHEFSAPEPEVYPSPPAHYRQRAEFRLWHEGYDIHYLMFAGKEPIRVTAFLPGSLRIGDLMQGLREELQRAPALRLRLYQVEFLTTMSGEALLSLIYHRTLDGVWEDAAHSAQARLGARIVGRSRRQRLVVGADFVTERLSVDGNSFAYRQPEGCFTQPNAEVNRAMLGWARRACAGSQDCDLLELYCGIGNFTVALAPLFRRALATEVGASAIGAAQHNLHANGIDNVFVARLSSAEAASALSGERPYRRLADFDLDRFDPHTLFVDPPRVGLDARTLAFACRFERIVYVSCNPRTLRENMLHLGKPYRIERCALFDQFPYTPHMECGVVLRRQA